MPELIVGVTGYQNQNYLKKILWSNNRFLKNLLSVFFIISLIYIFA